MKKKLRILAIALMVICSSLNARAQLYDAQWVVGLYPSLIDFRNNTIQLAAIDSMMLDFETIGNMCNKDGDLLFWTNGVYIANRNGDTMVNGDSLSFPSEFYNQINTGMPSREGIVILPMPGDTNRYYLFHYSPVDTLDIVAGFESLNLYYSIVDMSRDSGRGAVIEKNVPIIQNEMLSYSRLSACKHANGRDWWIVKNAWDTSIYYTFLLTPDGVHGPFVQNIGPNYGPVNEQSGYSAFSPDGTKYASITAVSHVVVMDFDRCTGIFSNPTSFYNNDSNDPINNPSTGGVSLCFSPSGRYLYVNNSIELNQYDLLPSRAQDSIRIETDTAFTEPFHMNILQLAPNGKIYVSCYNGGSYAIHVINQPDSLGLACDFVLLGQPVISEEVNAIPYFPNYRLGPLIGSGCDTLTAVTSVSDLQPDRIMLSPNPGTDYTTISLSRYHKNAKLYVYDMLGKEAYHNDSMYLDDTIDIRSFSSGVYLVRVLSPDGDLMGKFVKE